MKNVIVTLEYRFKRTPDGKIWTEMSFQYPFWQRYLNIFDQVIVVARVQEVESLSTKHHRVDGDNVHIEALPYYHGPLDFFKKKSLIAKALNAITLKYKNESIIMRVGSPIADILQNELVKQGRPYGLEVVGDPWDVFRPGTFNNPLRPFMRVFFAWKLKQQCSKAVALSYVTDQALQARYPGRNGSFSIGASSINLESEHLVNKAKSFEKGKVFKFIYVGTLEQLQKAPDVLIKAAHGLSQTHKNFELHIIGEGKCKPELQELSKDLGISKNVIFHGMVPAGDGVRKLLDASDVFVLPSRGEGLPRAMIEAMARALPCIGSDIGGIRELIPSEDIVEVGSVSDLAGKMRNFIENQDQLTEKSGRNLEKAKNYLSPILTKRRNDYYGHIRNLTTNWLNE